VRILVVSNLYPPVVVGGYEVECSTVVERLRRRHEVCVLTSNLRHGSTPSDPGVVRELPFMRYARRDSLRAPLAALRATATARRTLRSFEPEMLFVWNGAQIPQAALHVLAAAELPLAFRVCEHWFGQLFRSDHFMRHLTPGERGLRGAWARLMRLVNRHPALRLDTSRPARAAISWNSETMRRLTPVPPAVVPVLERVIHSTTLNAERFRGLERRPLERPTVAYVGRVEEEKGPDVAYHALAKLRSEHGIDARLVVAGPAEEGTLRELAELADRLGISEHVDVRGPLDPEAIGELLQGAHAVVVPSVWEEPFPLVCIEAALARVPVVASRIGGIPECLHHGEHALLFPPGDADACAAALADTLTDAAATEHRTRRAFGRGREFSLDGYLDASERFVEDTVAAFGG
jgi:glycogen(starch) synthase